MEIKAGWPGLDELSLDLRLDSQNQIESFTLRVVGGPELLALAEQWRTHFKGKVDQVPLPEGDTPAVLLIRELILKAQNKWTYPYTEAELCHCRSIATDKVDQAIVYGAHRPEVVSRRTSASTACGTCRPNVEEIIAYRLQSTNHSIKAA